MKELLNRYDLFSLPVWRFGFTEFDQHKDALLGHLTDDRYYLAEHELSNLQTTDGDLHCNDVHQPLAPLKLFMQSCIEEVMGQMGYERDAGITSMWATRQRLGGYHHQHFHKNTFLGAAFYLYDSDGSANGTSFINHNAQMWQIQPKIQAGATEGVLHNFHVPFIPGTCVVFPGWAQHGTFPSNSKYRIMVGLNSMPIGRSNGDHYHQYCFRDPAETGFLNLEEHIKDGYGKK